MTPWSDALRRFAAGGVVLIADPRTDRTLVAAPADTIEGFTVERLVSLGGGPVVVAFGAEIADALELPDGVPIDAAWGIGTGRSAEDRARTIRAATALGAQRRDLVLPGHVHHVRASGGADATSAAVALAFHSGHTPAAALCAIVDRAGRAVPPADARRDPRRAHLPLLRGTELSAAPEWVPA